MNWRDYLTEAQVAELLAVVRDRAQRGDKAAAALLRGRLIPPFRALEFTPRRQNGQG
jgi:hypothetical protein